MYGVGLNPVYMQRMEERKAKKERSGQADQERADAAEAMAAAEAGVKKVVFSAHNRMRTDSPYSYIAGKASAVESLRDGPGSSAGAHAGEVALSGPARSEAQQVCRHRSCLGRGPGAVFVEHVERGHDPEVQHVGAAHQQDQRDEAFL